MSNKETATGTEASVDDAEFAEVDEIVAPESEVTDTAATSGPARKKGAGLIAWVALLFAVVAVVAIAFDVLRDRGTAGEAAQSDERIRTLTASLGATQDALASLEQSVSALSTLDEERNATIERIGRRLDDRLQQLESLPGRMSSVETSMSSLQGISTGARAAWLLAEAEYYMQIANAQLQLAGNPQLASLALSHADERILQLADPRLTNVRQALSDELRALEVLEKPDTAGITLTLASLAGVVESLPLRQEAVVRDDSAPTGLDPELTGVDRAMASVRNAVRGIVSVRRADEAMQPLIAPDAQYFLRANLALQLQAARLAILRGEEVVVRQSLDDADAWLGEYYDPNSSAVQNARSTIAEIRGSVLHVAIPDISGSLRQLRQFNALADAEESSQAATPADAVAPEETDVPEQDQ